MTASRFPDPAARASGLRVLLVEDDADAAETFRRLLELRGHEVRVRHEGRGAIDCAREQPFDAVLCDVGLPGDCSGRDVARALRRPDSLHQRTPRPLLIAISGYEGPEHEAESLEAGFDAHLAKPVDRERLERLFDRARGHSRR